jgi:hypothetical protein
MTKLAIPALLLAVLAGCAMSSDVMDTGNGTYMISAVAAPLRGGAAGANSVAYADANTFCASKVAGTHAIVIGQSDRDVYQSSRGNTFAAGNAALNFRCGR